MVKLVVGVIKEDIVALAILVKGPRLEDVAACHWNEMPEIVYEGFVNDKLLLDTPGQTKVLLATMGFKAGAPLHGGGGVQR